MLKLPITLALALALVYCPPLAAKEEKDPIDIRMDEAMEQDPSTAGMVEAIDAAEKQWEKEMTRALKRLEEAMEPEEWSALQASQKAWRAYRSKELQAQRELYGRMEGTMWVPVAASSAMEVVRERTLQLRSYLETVTER